MNNSPGRDGHEVRAITTRRTVDHNNLARSPGWGLGVLNQAIGNGASFTDSRVLFGRLGLVT